MAVRYYDSPRWSGEITDCALPMTFDQYSLCGYRCLYCFSFFQKAIGGAKGDYLKHKVRPVNVEKVMRIFVEPGKSQFGPFVKARKVMQWGGLADPFCPYERKHGVGLELIRFFRQIEYPISFSTKGVWWLDDDRYRALFEGAKHFHVKVSLITLNQEKASAVEKGCPSVERRLQAIEKLAALGIGGVTLRLRPFIIGVSTPSYLDLIREAARRGADSVSTEFMCLETRSKRARPRWEQLSRAAGYDVLKLYKQHSPGSGYLRLNRDIKRPYMLAMKELCDELGLRFYVSDADWKELSHNSCCCGLSEGWNYSRGQFTEALMIAKREERVRWGDIEDKLDWANVLFTAAGCGNKTSSEVCAKYHGWTQADYLHYHWNNTASNIGPYRYFGGVLVPVERDENGDLVYEYQGE